MRVRDLEAILRALNDADVRFLIVGGLAVVAHGYLRYTADIDLVLDLEPQNTLRAMTALEAIGYRPLIPVEPKEFADKTTRDRWRKEKGMLVFQMLDPARPDTRIDLFVDEPFDFDKEFAAARWEEFAGTRAPVVSVETLVEMKKQVGRSQDLADIDQLRKIAANQQNEQPED
jgi:predicted nucleotidyltransferase